MRSDINLSQSRPAATSLRVAAPPVLIRPAPASPIAAAHVVVLLAAALLVVGCAREPLTQETGIAITETSGGYLFTEHGDSVLVYHAQAPDPERAHSRSHYAHPLFALDGTVLTEDFPEDHPHQHGLYSAWHQLYVGERRVGDGWEQEDVTWDVRDVEVLEGDASSAVRARVAWISPRYAAADGRPEPFLEESATLRVYPAHEHHREIDVSIALRALVDSVRIGGSEDEKGYGGFSLRVRLPEDVQFVGPAGPVEPQETAVEAGPWVDVSATYGQAPSGVTILQHPSNPGYPQPWILRSEASMQNPKWPGETPVLIPTDESVTLRYRLVVHAGRLDALSVDDLHARYALE